MTAQFFDKFPDEIRDFAFDASGILLNGDTIQSVVVVAISAGLTVVSSGFNNGSTPPIVSFRISGGIQGTVASVAVKATLTSGQLREGIVGILIKPVPTS